MMCTDRSVVVFAVDSLVMPFVMEKLLSMLTSMMTGNITLGRE